MADGTCESTAEDVVLLKVNLGLLVRGLGLLVGGLRLLVGGLGLAKADGGGLLVGPDRCLSMYCVSEASVTGRMKTAKPVRGQPAETEALFFCFLSSSDPGTQKLQILRRDEEEEEKAEEGAKGKGRSTLQF